MIDVHPHKGGPVPLLHEDHIKIKPRRLVKGEILTFIVKSCSPTDFLLDEGACFGYGGLLWAVEGCDKFEHELFVKATIFEWNSKC